MLPEQRALDVLHDLSRHGQECSGDDYAQILVDTLEQGMGYDLLAVLVYAEPDGALLPLALSKQGQDEGFLEKDKAYVKSRFADPTQGLTGWVARTGRSVRLGSVVGDSRYVGVRDDIRSELCVALKVRGEVIGVLNTETIAPDAYTRRDEQFLETAAAPIALAIECRRQRRDSEESPIVSACSYCKAIRMAEGPWQPPEVFLLSRFGVRLSHGVCPRCGEGLLDKLKH